MERSCADRIAPKTILSIMGVRKLPLTHGNQTWTPRRRVPFTRDHGPLAPAGGLLRTLAAAGVSPALGLTAVPGTPVAVATAREGVEGTRRPGCCCHLPERLGRGGLCAGDPPGVADTDRQFAGDVSGLRHEPGTLVEHFRTAELVGLCEAAVTGATSPDAEWRCQPTGRRRDRGPGGDRSAAPRRRPARGPAGNPRIARYRAAVPATLVAPQPRRRSGSMVSPAVGTSVTMPLGHFPNVNGKFWKTKILRNREGDVAVTGHLREDGYHVLRMWEHELAENLSGCIDQIRQALQLRVAE